jgi:hypothetical protein
VRVLGGVAGQGVHTVTEHGRAERLAGTGSTDDGSSAAVRWRRWASLLCLGSTVHTPESLGAAVTVIAPAAMNTFGR